jgi:hypothetical protein
VCLVGAYLGKSKIDGYVKKTGRASLLILILGTIIALATVGCVVILLTRLADNEWCLDGFIKFCKPLLVVKMPVLAIDFWKRCRFDWVPLCRRVVLLVLDGRREATPKPTQAQLRPHIHTQIHSLHPLLILLLKSR